MAFCHCVRNYYTHLSARTTWVSQYRKGRTIPDFNEARRDGVAVVAGPYSNQLHFTPDSTHHSV